MPEAAIHEHCHLRLCEGDVSVGYLSIGHPDGIVLPEPESAPMQQGRSETSGLVSVRRLERIFLVAAGLVGFG